MVRIQPTETQLTGNWLSLNGRVVADEICRRIGDLVASHLKELGRDSSGWDALYRDPDDGRLWELTRIRRASFTEEVLRNSVV